MPPKIDQYLRRRETTLEQMKAIETFAKRLTDTCDVMSVKARLENLQELMRTFSEAEDELFARDSETVSQAVDCDEIYYSAIAKLNRFIHEDHQRNISQNQSMGGNHDNTSGNFNQSNREVKLPRITLPTFDGNYQEWQSFNDMFIATVHDNPNLSGVQKFQYLKGSLRGEASTSLRHLAITENNYIEAYQKLVKRYSKKKLTINAYINTFVNQPKLPNASAKHLRQICDTSDDVIRGIRALGSAAEGRDPWLIYLVLAKLDEDTRERWANETTGVDFPTWQGFNDFLNKRADSLEHCQPASKPSQSRSTSLQIHTADIKSCPLCNTTHHLYECSTFKEMPINARREFMQKANRCYNCLCNSHTVSRCRSRRSCLKCRKRHHTLLHLDITVDKPEDKKIPLSDDSTTTTNLLLVNPSSENIKSYQTKSCSTGLLQTALVNIRGANNEFYPCRALLDSGSLASFITEACVQKLGLSRINHRIVVEGLTSSKVGVTRGKVKLEVFSRTRPELSFHVEGLVLPSITSQQPHVTIDQYYWDEFIHLDLADPTFNKPGDIDILIGCDHYMSLILAGQIKATNTNLIARETVLGWIISGSLNDRETSKITNLCTTTNIDKALTRFWEIEEIKTTTPQTQQELYCEHKFTDNFKRDCNGRYVVVLPFDPDAAPLGESKSHAIKRLQSVERRLAKDPDLKSKYVKFMREYHQLGHMERIPDAEVDIPWNRSYYLPHHFVYKETSTTTKLRVVFDGSAKTKTGRSLNQNLVVGPQIQQTLQQILLRFRFHRYVMTADLEKMYRQILVTPEHTEFQRILWREEPTDQILEYRLRTVTYGTASAPFLSTRVLKQIANDNRHKLPNASNVIERDFYVDDLMTGTDTIEQLITLKGEITNILKNSGFNLRKWLSNCLPLEQASPDQRKLIEIEKDSQYSKVLGIYWNTNSDLFSYRVSLNEAPTMTKRGMLSESSRLFDPQGWLAPITIFVKIIFQRTWAKALDWDDQLPNDIADDWCKFRMELKSIESITIPRWLKFGSSTITLHGFSDASQNAYAAVIYAVCSKEDGTIEVTIVSAKTRVAPIRRQITIPKLELCAALLLTKSMDGVQLALGDREHKIYMWTDSTIVLSWLETVPRSLDVFLGNRVSQIIANYPRNRWRHVATKENPADCASRGILPSELVHHNLWWTGPKWLQYQESNWPHKVQPTVTCILTTYPAPIEVIVARNSNFNKIIRVLAYCRRYIKNCKVKADKRIKTLLNCSELCDAKELLIKYVQEKNFHIELKLLNNTLPIPKHHKLANLNPFLDENGIFRVGGRIQHATVPFDVKHPIILPAEDIISEILIRTTHEELLCGNHSLVLTTLKRNYWIINCKLIIRRVIKKCIKCSRYTSKPIQPLMGDLPTNRVNLVRAFLSTGVDYAGPIYVRPSKRRGLKPDKAYIAVFICLSTKAIHLELAGDLSTDSFIAAFRRFISRRGLCHEIISDNGSNFIGAKNDLNELFNIVNDTKISTFLTNKQIIWKFNPPTGSHFGGIYEAAVKSTKYHLKRTLVQASLTYEEMSTLLAQIEAILNSRPLCVTSDDDINPLTPAHFLIGHPFTYLPDLDLNHLKLNSLSRWQYLQRLRQDFWRKWHTTYLTSLQKRTKWQTASASIKENDIVLLHEINLPPNHWKMGRVVALHPGHDNIVRVVTVQTASGKLRRPVVKLSVLPIAD